MLQAQNLILNLLSLHMSVDIWYRNSKYLLVSFQLKSMQSINELLSSGFGSQSHFLDVAGCPRSIKKFYSPPIGMHRH